MSGALERRTLTPLGWPKAGALFNDEHGNRVPVLFGAGQLIWVDDPTWGRQFITALTVAVHQLEALQSPTEPAPDLGGEPEPAVDEDVPETDAPADEPDPTDQTDDTAQEVAHVH